jgi:hypothetical protein
LDTAPNGDKLAVAIARPANKRGTPRLVKATFGNRLRASGSDFNNQTGAVIFGAMPRGGHRAGSGRPKGACDKHPRLRMRDLAAQVRADAMEMPIDRLIRRLNDASLSEEYRDKLAVAIAPYCSPRLSSVAITKRPGQMNDEEMIGLTEEDMLRLGIEREKWPRPLH